MKPFGSKWRTKSAFTAARWRDRYLFDWHVSQDLDVEVIHMKTWSDRAFLKHTPAECGGVPVWHRAAPGLGLLNMFKPCFNPITVSDMFYTSSSSSPSDSVLMGCVQVSVLNKKLYTNSYETESSVSCEMSVLHTSVWERHTNTFSYITESDRKSETSCNPNMFSDNNNVFLQL